MPEPSPDLAQLVEQVRKGSSYAQISPDLVLSVLTKELEKGARPKEAVKAARSKLHQVGAAYQEVPPPYDKLLAEMETLPRDLADPAVRAFLQRAMNYHASTRERLPILPRFFTEAFDSLGSLHSILDLACGLNPLAIPWMPLQPGFSYTACDVYSDLVGFLNRFFAKFCLDGHAKLCDLTREIPSGHFDLVLVLKTIPCLEQLDKSIGATLLERLNANAILVSFPSRSLGGHSKGMPQYYEAHFYDLIAGKPWQVSRFSFTGELAFLVQK